ncbi:hypothetical protein GCM10010273_65720 [Streptomyces lavendulocolor]
MVDEGPGADHPAAEVGQQAAYLGGLTELYAAGAQQLAHRLRDDESPAAAHGGHGLTIKVAHASNLAVPGRRA